MIFITGATGMLGALVALKLSKKNYKIIAIKRKSSQLDVFNKIFKLNNAENLKKNIEWCTADILDYDSIKYSMQNCLQVFHCAAQVSLNSQAGNDIVDNNVNGTKNVVEAALENKIRYFVHVSSIAALGFSENIIDENTERSSNVLYSKYSKSKYESEKEVWRGIAEGLNAVIINPAVILGPGDWTKGSSSIFYEVWKGLKFYSSGKSAYVDIEDVANIMIILFEQEISGSRYIVSSENVYHRDILNMIAKCFKKPAPKINSSAFLLNIGYFLNKIWAFISGQDAILTKEFINTVNKVENYSNKKLLEIIDYKYISIKKSIEKNVEYFLKELEK